MSPDPDPDDPAARLWPPPRRLRRTGAAAPDPGPARGDPEAAGLWATARGLFGLPPAPAEGAPVRCERRADLAGEAYALVLDGDGARLAAGGRLGFLRGLTTLAQLVAGGAPLPGVEIEDAPRFARRGVMLDVSRDRVPRPETLRAIVDRLAAWKVDQLQLYVEHTFAYAGHEEVWRGASPLEPDEVRALDAYCAERGVELVPNQQSFGHLHRWLVRPRYRPLAECPEGVVHPFSTEREPFSLCPSDPAALALLADLYDQLLPCFSSDTINVGLDETFDLGLGRSREECEARGRGRVYTDFLREVHRLVSARQRRMQYWADVALAHPECIEDLPRDATAMLWGYDADHPFEEQAARLAAAGLPFFVCPGTSAWQSFGGRTRNALANLRSAARHGSDAGAAGYVVTDWGDRGHHQPLAVSAFGLWYAAGCGWSGEEALPTDEDALAGALSRHAFGDPGGSSGRAALLLGDVGRAVDAGSVNGTAPFFLVSFAGEPLPHERMPRLAAEGLERGLARIEEASAALEGARPADPRDGVELAWTRDVLRFACDLGLARLGSADGAAAVRGIPAARRAALAAELAPLIERHRAQWLVRHRPGGLEDSCRWLERLRDALDS